MQKDILHYGGVEHRDLHNQHGVLFHRATALALQQRGKALYEDGDRPFVLTRSFFAGSQRWGPMWTGDNTATWEMLAVSVPMLLSSGLAGYPFAGSFLTVLSHQILPQSGTSLTRQCPWGQVQTWGASLETQTRSYSHAGISWGRTTPSCAATHILRPRGASPTPLASPPQPAYATPFAPGTLLRSLQI